MLFYVHQNSKMFIILSFFYGFSILLLTCYITEFWVKLINWVLIISLLKLCIYSIMWLFILSWTCVTWVIYGYYVVFPSWYRVTSSTIKMFSPVVPTLVSPTRQSIQRPPAQRFLASVTTLTRHNMWHVTFCQSWPKVPNVSVRRFWRQNFPTSIHSHTWQTDGQD